MSMYFDFKFGSLGSRDGEFNFPIGVAYDHKNDRIIVTDADNNRIQVFSSNGNFLFKFGNYGSRDGEFYRPEGVAYDHNNDRIIVTDTLNHRVQIFDSNGNFLFKFGNYGSGDGQFNWPCGVAYDHNNDRIIVTDTDNDRVQVFSSNGNFLFKFGNYGSGDGQFNCPYGVAYDHNNDRIIVVVSNRVQVLGSLGSRNVEFRLLFGVAYDHNNDRIIVVDAEDYSVQVFSNYSLYLYESNYISDGIIDLGDTVIAKALTTKKGITSVTFRWINPSNNEVRTNTVSISDGEASDAYTPDEVGTWQVIARFSDGTTIVKELNAPFQVVPL